MSDNDKSDARLLESQTIDQKELLRQAQEAVCSLLCPSKWKTGERPPHSNLCRQITESLLREQDHAKVPQVQNAGVSQQRVVSESEVPEQSLTGQTIDHAKEKLKSRMRPRTREQWREVDADLDELIAAVRRSGEPGWQPIETAPKDGTQVDLWCGANGRGWRFLDAFWRGEPFNRWDNHYSQHVKPEIVTHWMHVEPPRRSGEPT